MCLDVAYNVKTRIVGFSSFMNIFEITIQRQTKNGWPVVVKYTKTDKVLPICRQGIFKLKSDDNFAELTALLGQPKQYGTMLGKALFSDDVRDTFVSALATLQNNNDTYDYLHVLLYSEAEELKELRWEKLCAPLDGDWDFLALNQQIPFSLYIPAITERLFPAMGRRDLQALIVVASPEGEGRFDLDPFDVEATVSSVKAALGDIPCDVLAMVNGAIGPPTFDTLMKYLTVDDRYYTLLHLVCHGKVLANGETVIYLSNPHNQVDAVPATTLIDRLTNLRRAPHFAFLSTCSSASASAEAEGGKGGLAQRLVRELGMPAVVAMTEPISINTAQALATTFYQRLKAHGNVDLALVQANAGLQGRYDITVPALFSRLGGRPLFSDTPDRPLTEKEIKYGLERMQQLLPERAPILCQELTNQVTVLQRTLGTQTDVSKTEQQKALAVVSELSTKVLDLDFKALALGNEVPAYDTRCPFRGLYPFCEADSEFFCGRGTLIKELRQKLAEHNFLPVLGASGSGKSSIVMAGLIPELQKQEPELVMAYMTPRSNPLEQLQASLLKVQNQPTVLLVDQFEELFTLCLDQAWRLDFIHQLFEVAQKQKVIITMRADFWGECAPYPELRDLMEKRQKLIAPMTIDELHHSIEMQAAKVGLRFEVDLVNKILDDVEGEPGAMPLLQHALQELWLRRHGRWLLSQEHRAIGGVQLAIANTADEFYNRCSGLEKELLKNIFLRLTRLDLNAVEGEKLRDTRQRVELEDLILIDGDEAVTKKLVNELASLRLVMTSVNDVTKKQEVEVAHEALIRHWQKLKEWLIEGRNSLILRQDINTVAQDWEKNRNDESYLVHQGGRLEEAEQLRQQFKLKLNKLENDYLNACIERRDRILQEKSEQQKRELEHQKKARKAGRIALTTLIAAPLMIAFVVAITQGINWREKQESDIRKLNNSSKNLLRSNQGFEALINNLKTAKKLKNIIIQPKTLEQELLPTLQETLIREVKEINRIEDNSIALSGDGQIIASVSKDKKLTFWSMSGEKIKTLDIQDRVDSLDPLGLQFIQGSDQINNKVTIWDTQGNLLYKPSPQNQQSAPLIVEFNPQIIAIVSDKKTVNLWKAQRKLFKTLQHDDVKGIASSADGKTIVSYSNKSIKIWNQDGSKILQSNDFQKVFVSADVKKIATISRDNTIKIWNMDGTLIKFLNSDKVEVTDMSFSSNGKMLLSKHPNGVVIWNTDTGQSKNLSQDSEVTDYLFSPDSQRIVTAEKKNLKLWSCDGELLATLIGHQSNINMVSFSNDSQLIATASNDKTVKLWSRDGQQLKTLQHDFPVRTVKFSADGKTIATMDEYDHNVHIWNLDSLKSRFQKLISNNQGIKYVTFSPDGKMIATANESDNTVKIWNLQGKELQTLKGHKGKKTSVTFSPDGKTIATANESDNTVKIWNLQGKELQILKGHKGGVTSVTFSPDGKTIATASFDETAKLWNLQGKELRTLQGHDDWVLGVTFSPDGKTIATASFDETAKLWNLQGKELRTLQGHDDWVLGVTFCPDDKIITFSLNGTLKQWNSNGEEQKSNSIEHFQTSAKPIFSPNCKIIATTSGDNEVQLWNLDGQLLETLLGHNDETTSVSFSPDGRWLVTASLDKSVIRWNLDSDSSILLDKKFDDLIKDACKLLSNYLKNNPEQADDLACDGRK